MTDNRIDNHRFLTILEKSNNKSYYYSALLFCKKAEKMWLYEPIGNPILHGYSHLSIVLKNQDLLLSKLDDDDILLLIGDKYLFILLAATYIHDFGMKAYYSLIYPEYDDVLFNDLPDDIKIEIRKIHNEIIDNALNKIIDNKTIVDFFGNSILQYLEMTLKGHNILIDDIKKNIINNSKQIGIVAKYHNQNLSELDFLISRLKTQRKIHIDDNEEKKLIIISSILQFSDALDMSISRLDVDMFHLKLNEIDNSSLSDYNLIYKSLRCYMIDRIEAEYENKNTLNIKFYMSLSERNLNENFSFIKGLKNDYEKRLKRNDRDCLRRLEDAFNFKTNIICLQETVTINLNKEIIPDTFFQIEQSDRKTMLRFLEHKIKNLSGKSILTFFKFYSNSSNIFYGGVCYFPTKSESELDGDDLKINSFIENSIFDLNDWQIDCTQEFSYSRAHGLKNFGLNDRHNIVTYKEYFKYYKHKCIKSEIHFPLNYQNKRIGYVKFHYINELTVDEVIEETQLFRKSLKLFGLELNQIFEKRIINQYTLAIKNSDYIKQDLKHDFILLFKNLFVKYPGSVPSARKTYISELKEILNIQCTLLDKVSYLIFNKDILKNFFDESNKLKGIYKVVWSLANDSIRKMILIECSISSFIDNPLLSREFRQASVYFDEDFPDEIASNFRLARIVLPLKCFVVSFGGKIFCELANNNNSLIIKMIFSKSFE